MAIPKDILAVERPKSTRVKQGFNGTYYVVKRTSKYVNGKAIPVELGTIGYIVDHQYVELRKTPRETNKNVIARNGKVKTETKAKSKFIDIKTFGSIKLAYECSKEILDELKAVYDEKTSNIIYSIALLRSIECDIKNRDVEIEYKTSYLSEIIKDLPLSKSTISDYLFTIGTGYSSIHQFMKNRMKNADLSKCVIDGTIKKNTSETNINSEYSRKAHEKTGKDVSIIYMYNIETKEPVISKVFPGNMLDSTAIEEFVDEYDMNNQILGVFDKGFFNAKTIKKWDDEKNLSYLIAMKDNTKLLKENDVYKNIVTPLEKYKEAIVFYKKVPLEDGHYLYAFRDPKIASDQETSYTKQKLGKDKCLEAKLIKKSDSFGVLVLYSNKDLNPYDVYIAYQNRWEIEIMFNLYKNVLDLDTTNVTTEYRDYSTEFINHISILIASRIKKKFSEVKIKGPKGKEEKPLSELYSYCQLMRYLRKMMIIRCSEDEEWIQNKTVGYIAKIGEALNLTL